MAGTRQVNEEQTFAGPQVFSQGVTVSGTLTLGGSPLTAGLIDGTASDIQPSPGTRAAGSVGMAADSGHVHGSPPAFAPGGLTGATSASRYAGATTGGPPSTGTFSTGDWIIAYETAFACTWICVSGGTPGTWFCPAASSPELYKEPFIASSTTPPLAVTSYRANGTSTVSPGSGTAMYSSVPLVKGQVISNLSLLSLGGETGGSHCWVALADTGAVVRAVSADNTGATFWAGNTAKTLSLSTGGPYTVPATGLYLCVFGMTATGMATFVGGNNLGTGEAGWGSGLAACGTAGSIGAPPSTGTTLTLS